MGAIVCVRYIGWLEEEERPICACPARGRSANPRPPARRRLIRRTVFRTPVSDNSKGTMIETSPRIRTIRRRGIGPKSRSSLALNAAGRSALAAISPASMIHYETGRQINPEKEADSRGFTSIISMLSLPVKAGRTFYALRRRGGYATMRRYGAKQRAALPFRYRSCLATIHYHSGSQ